MLVSSVGVAQVSHLCKLAIAGMETVSCKDLENENHGCCNMNDQEDSKDDSCCKDQVRYFQNKISGTVQEMYHSFPVDVVIITLLNPNFSITESSLLPSQNIFHNAWFPPGKSGRQLILSINSLLI